MKRKGRLGGKAWFYAQGQRAWSLRQRGRQWMLELSNVPAFARHAFMQGYNDSKYAQAGKPV